MPLSDYVPGSTAIVLSKDVPAYNKAAAANLGIAVCDGVNDEVEIQAAIDALPATGGTLVLSEGTFNIGSAILPKSYTTIRGQGMEATKLIKSTSGHIIDFEGASTSNRKERLYIENLTLQGSSSSSAGMYSKFVYGPNIIRCVRFKANGTNGVEMGDNGTSFLFDSCRFDSNTLAGVKLGVSTNPQIFLNCIWSSNAQEGLLINGDTNEITIIGGNFNANGYQALAILSTARSITIIGTHFEFNATALPDNDDRCHILLGTDTYEVSNVFLNTLWFNGEDGSGTAHTKNGIKVHYSHSTQVVNCCFRKLTQAGVYIKDNVGQVGGVGTLIINPTLTTAGFNVSAGADKGNPIWRLPNSQFDFAWAELARETLYNLSSDPSTGSWGSAEKGRVWFNTTSNVIKYWDGGAIKTVTAS